MELMSKWNACIFLFITHVLDEKILDGTQSRISKNLKNSKFSKKLAILVELIHS
jgi:hypothetical protein